MSMRPVLGITMGDPAGVGPELCLRAINEPEIIAKCVPVLFADAVVLERLSQVGFPKPNCKVIPLTKWNALQAVTEPVVIDCAAITPEAIEPAKVSAACGRAAFTYIVSAIDAALAGRIAGVVTAPINKEALRLAGVEFPGHTEIFTVKTGAKRTCMMLWSETMAVSMVTTHIGYADVPNHLSVERILDVIELTAETLRCLLGRSPRLAVCGLNPHAGEHGLFGQREEERFIIPAVSEAQRRQISIEGPLPPDAAFTPVMRKRFDGYITLYHDQGHIPFKMLAFDTGVNITLGLPIIRTSVDHGTAFDIAWKGVANPQSLFAAIDVAVRLAKAKAA